MSLLKKLSKITVLVCPFYTWTARLSTKRASSVKSCVWCRVERMVERIELIKRVGVAGELVWLYTTRPFYVLVLTIDGRSMSRVGPTRRPFSCGCGGRWLTKLHQQSYLLYNAKRGLRATFYCQNLSCKIRLGVRFLSRTKCTQHPTVVHFIPTRQAHPSTRPMEYWAHHNKSSQRPWLLPMWHTRHTSALSNIYW